MAPLVSVIVVNHNKKDLLRRCLKSISWQSYPNVELIVIDNASSDTSSDMMRADFPEAKIIQNDSNELFAYAINQGIRHSKGEFILSINNDTHLAANYIDEAVSIFSLDERIGMVQGKILLHNTGLIDSAGLFLSRGLLAVEIGHKKLDKGQFDACAFREGVGGAVACYRRKMLEDIKEPDGYFDEKFSFFYEDIDLCLRARKRGWKAYYNFKANASHIRGASCQSAPSPLNPFSRWAFLNLDKDFKILYLANRYYLVHKHITTPQILKNLPWIIPLEIRNWLYLALFEPRLIRPTIARTRTLIKKK